MNYSTPQSPSSLKGIVFTVKVDSLKRECMITDEALNQLSAQKNMNAANASQMDIFHAFEDRIKGVARRLIAARVPGTPLLMQPNTFNPPHTD